MNHFAFSGRDGLIEFAPFVPNGRLPIASSADQARLRETIEGICRHAYDGESLLVPGIPEAESDDQALDAFIEFRRRVADRLELGRAWPDAPAAEPEPEPAPPAIADPFAPGAILASSWGYEQTNVDFYRVEKVKGDWVTLQEIASSETADGDMTGRVVPADPVELINEPFRRKRRPGSEYVKISSYEFASPWDGTPQRVSHYG